jgi:isopenicillin N synthase-like dioxygenase
MPQAYYFHLTPLTHQVETTGFFSVTGTGFTEEELARQYDIGQAFFNQPLEAKTKPELRCDFGKGNYFGYRAVRRAPRLDCTF